MAAHQVDACVDGQRGEWRRRAAAPPPPPVGQRPMMVNGGADGAASACAPPTNYAAVRGSADDQWLTSVMMVTV